MRYICWNFSVPFIDLYSMSHFWIELSAFPYVYLTPLIFVCMLQQQIAIDQYNIITNYQTGTTIIKWSNELKKNNTS